MKKNRIGAGWIFCRLKEVVVANGEVKANFEMMVKTVLLALISNSYDCTVDECLEGVENALGAIREMGEEVIPAG